MICCCPKVYESVEICFSLAKYNIQDNNVALALCYHLMTILPKLIILESFFRLFSLSVLPVIGAHVTANRGYKASVQKNDK